MSGAQGNALDWALALAKAPGERHALRQRALPEEMDTLIQIAGGSAADAVALATARTGESAARIVEAARFYLREVLFFPQADAYRLLGVSCDAEQARIRAHHRLLQQWLHPDRSSEEDAIFAARVNAAWDQLRQPERRAAYDRSLPAPAAQAAPDDGVYPLRPWIPVALPEALDVPVEERWRRRVPLLILLSACIGLGVITVQHQQRLDEAGGLPPAETPGDALPVLRLPGRAADPPPVEAARSGPSASPAAVAEQLPVPLAVDLTHDDPFQTFTDEEDPTFAIPPEDVPVIAAAPQVTPAVRRPADAPPQRTAAVAAEVPTAEPTPSPTPVTAQPRRVTVAAAQARPEQRVVTANAKPVAPAVAPSSPVVPDPQRVLAAQHVGERLLAYLIASGRTVPAIWNSVSAERAAAQIRGSIARGQGPRFEIPTWRITETDAALQVGLHFRDGREGRLRASLTWREQRWLVSNLSMEQDW